MRHVIVRPAFSYGVLGLGITISLVLAWQAYKTISYISEAEATAAAYHQVQK